MGGFLGLPKVLETDNEDENHVGLARPRLVLWFIFYLILPQNGIRQNAAALRFAVI